MGNDRTGGHTPAERAAYPRIFFDALTARRCII